MRILSINKFYYIHGGSERYLFDLNAILENQGHQIIPFAMDHSRNEKSNYSRYFTSELDFSSENMMDKAQAGLNIIYSREAQNKLDALIKEVQPQIAHLHNIAHQLSPSILFALRQNKVPIIQTLHDLKLICPTYTMYTQGQVCERCITGQYINVLRYRCNKNSLGASAINMIEMYLHKTILHSYDKVDAFIAPSSFLRNKMIESGISPNRIHHIPNFVKVNEYTPDYENDGYLLFFGQLIDVKGLDVLLRAFEKLPEVRLIIAGRGAERVRFETFVQEHNLKNVSFVGFQSGDNLRKLIQKSLAVIVPSVWYENQPYSIMEAFAYGKPVIASNLGGMTELVSDNTTGYLFEAGNHHDLVEKVQMAVSHPNQILDMGHTAREKVEHKFNADLHLQRITKLYKSFL